MKGPKGQLFKWQNVLIPIAIEAVRFTTKDPLGGTGEYTYKCLYVFGVRIAYWNVSFDRGK